MKHRRLILAIIVGCALILAFGLFRVFGGLLVDYWWFGSLGYSGVFLRILFTKVALWVVGFALGVFAVSSGFLLARRMLGPIPARRIQLGDLSLSLSAARRGVHALFWTAAVLAGLIAGGATHTLWHRVLLFLNRVPFGRVDPVFANDIGFYVFTLPILRNARAALQICLWVSLGSAAAYYLVAGAFSVASVGALPRRAVAHLNSLVGLIFLLTAAGYFLDRYGLLYSGQGVIYGAGYADLHARLPAYWLMLCVSVGVAVAFFVSRSPRRWRLIVGAVGVWVMCLVLAQGIYPQLVQWARVEPNELRLESPYIENGIEQTLKAYKLDSVGGGERYEVAEELSYEEVTSDRMTIENVRLWDWRPLLDTYRQLQALRLYYDFNDVDVDRYRLPGGYTQTMLSVREMHLEKLPREAQRWVNQRLQYTHGYGLCMSPVNEVTSDGSPELIIREIPPITPEGLSVQQVRVYYGESTDSYVFGGSRREEFDYPGETNVLNSYDGSGGVPVGGFFGKLLFALYFQDMKVLLSGELVPEARALFHRRIQARVRRVAPYLLLDRDPYPVLHRGRLKWIQDGYTTTRLHPYSQPSARGRFNYIRNSVKVVIDAYDGDLAFYVADPADPLIEAYGRIFPGVYRSMDKMPGDLRTHLRYPVDLFQIQTQKYRRFHMRDPQVFFSKEDLWEVPMEKYAGQPQPVQPYYVIMRLPKNETPEFILILPFTPRGKPNMVAWMAGRCDGEHYGELLAYRFPKEKWIPGPNQVESWIDQNPAISQQLTLWGQSGSRVIRGNLLVIPIAGGILFVEPLYIRAEADAIPQLKRVIVGHGREVAWAPTLSEALRKLFGAAPAEAEGEKLPAEAEQGPVVKASVGREARRILQEALDHLGRANGALRDGDWAEYGRQMDLMEERMKEAKGRLQAGKEQPANP